MLSAVVRLRQRGCEIERRVVRLVIVLFRDGLHGLMETRHVLPTERAPKFRCFEAPLGLADEVIDLRRRDAAEDVAQVAKAARLHAQLALAVQREDAAFAHHLRFFWKTGHRHDRREILARREAAGRGRFLRHEHVKGRGRLWRDLEKEQARRRGRALLDGEFERHALRFRHDFGRHVVGLPRLHLAVLVQQRRREFPRLRGFGDDARVRGDAAFQKDELTRLAVVV